MNELKPEYVMKALECCSVYETCDGCPHFDGVPEDDCCYKAMANALALLREKDADIKRRDAKIDTLQKQVRQYGAEIGKKDAEIEKLKIEVKRYENTCGKLIVRDNGEVVGFIDGQEKTYISKDIARVLRSMAVTTARDDAINEFAKELTSELIKGGIYPVFVKGAIERTAKKLKGETDGETDL